ncbi:MAG: hypothetical protein MJZ37_08460 [Bacilli bacterium]|nr:hypothetical protein [Bacilli bacterium]
MASKKTTETTMKYFINVCGKRTEVTKEEYEKRYPPVTNENTETATTE